jgi:putative NADH-flavin reductase
MKLILLGATGRTGGHVLDLALHHGHEVTAFVRTPGKLAPHERLHEVCGDPRTGAGLEAALLGHDAVICTLGAPPREALRPSTLMTEFGTTLASAMTASGVSRVAVLSAAVLFPGKGLFYRFFRWLLQHHARDLDAMERAFRSSRLAWTIVRPPRLVDSKDETCRTLVGDVPAGGRSISFRAVAAALLASVETRAHVREVIGVAR